jgi:hypothetical protein
MNTWINLHALWKIVVIGLLAGAGLPALFAIGLRAVSLQSPGKAQTAGGDSEAVIGDNPLGIAAGALCFLVVLAGIAWGIYMIVNG